MASYLHGRQSTVILLKHQSIRSFIADILDSSDSRLRPTRGLDVQVADELQEVPLRPLVESSGGQELRWVGFGASTQVLQAELDQRAGLVERG